MQNPKSKKGFTYAMLALIIFALMILLQMATHNKEGEFVSIAIGLTVLISFILAILGLMYSIQGLREPNSMQQIVGITVNGVFVILFILAIVANIMDIQKSLK